MGTRIARASVTETTAHVGVHASIVSTIMAAYTQQGRTSSTMHKSGRMSKLGERDRMAMKRIVVEKHKIISEMTTQLQEPASSNTIRRELQTEAHSAQILLIQVLE